MRATDVQTLSVSDHTKVVGTLTGQQIAERTPDRGKSPQHTRVDEIMEQGRAFAHENDDLTAVREEMNRLGVKTIPVLNHDEQITGSLSVS